MKKMTKSLFAEKRKMSTSMWCLVLDGKRSLSHDVAVRVARVLRTDTKTWKCGGFVPDRVFAWDQYVAKFNGGGK